MLNNFKECLRCLEYSFEKLENYSFCNNCGYTVDNTDKIYKVQKKTLLWVDLETKARFEAGNAFYYPTSNDYRLHLYGYRTGRSFYLKEYSKDQKRTLYKIIYPINIDGKFSYFKEVGSGYKSKNTNNQIVMKLGINLGAKLIMISKGKQE